MSNKTKIFALALAATTMIAGAAQAGGFSRGNADTDILFEEGNFLLRSGVTYVSPSQKVTYLHLGGPSAGMTSTGDSLPAFAVPSFAMKLQATESTACAGTLSQPFGASSDYSGTTTGHDNDSLATVRQQFTIHELGLTCSYSFDAGPGKLALIGGVYAFQLDYEQQVGFNPLVGGPTAALSLGDTGIGYRLGVAYSIPEIALRAQLLYRSENSIDATGTFDNLITGANLFPSSTGAATFPQSVEAKFQTGVAPGWLVFGSVKWTEWSVFEVLEYNATGTPSSLNFFWRDGWTVNAGVGHRINDQLAVQGSLTWDRGVGTGHDLQGADSWSFAAGGSYTPNERVELRAGGAVIFTGAATQTFLVPPAAPVGTFVPAPPNYKSSSSSVSFALSIGGRIRF